MTTRKCYISGPIASMKDYMDVFNNYEDILKKMDGL